MSYIRIVVVTFTAMALVVPMLFAATPTEGLELATDQSLAGSTASFWGEREWAQSGIAVCGAGDVNGDGYDDFLIGAFTDGEGRPNAGQTYLVLGKASGWTMDTNLSNADASFWGETMLQYSGRAVAGAGDVNGDGYDDFLIGAFGDSESGTSAGQTYLILGKASGWGMDTDLSQADASFLGETANDESGYAVAGAGDVNGDGFDDILIRAYMDDDNGVDAGQTYLILGKASCWAMDTSLSSADASFRGEEMVAYSGQAISGAGDVNGDGYDDFLIGAYGDGEASAGAGQTYLILGKESGWDMDTDLSQANASFLGEDMSDGSGRAVAGVGDVNGDSYDDFLIGAPTDWLGNNVGETYLVLGKASGWATDTDLSQADASFRGETTKDVAGVAVAGAGDVNGDGYDDFLIGALGNDDGGSEAGQTYLVLGKASGWATDSDLANANASFWGEAAGDMSGFQVAGAGDVNGDGCDDLLIGARANGEGGEGAGQTYLVSFDMAPPGFLEDSTPSEATTGDEFTFTVSVLDTSGVDHVSVEFWFGDAGDHINRSMVLSSGDRQNGTWTFTIQVPTDSLDALHYAFSALDGDGLFATTEVRDVPVRDDDPPGFGADNNFPAAGTGDTYYLRMEVNDNIDVAGLKVTYWFGSGTPTNVSMERSWVFPNGNGTYDLVLNVPQHSTDPLSYRFFAVDSAGNWAATDAVRVNVVDNKMVMFLDDLSDMVATTGDAFHLEVQVMDNLGVDSVRAIYWFGDDPAMNASMDAVAVVPVGNGTYSVDIPIPADSLDPLSYYFSAWDVSARLNWTFSTTVDVLDNDPPVADAGEDIEVDKYQSVPLDGSASSDNVGITSYTWTLELDGVNVTEDGTSPPLTIGKLGEYEVTLTVEDAAGNTATDTLTVTVLDTTTPVADAGDDIQVDQHTTVTFDGSGSTDNVAIVTHRWQMNYFGHGQDQVLIGPNPEFTFDRVGEYTVTLAVTDAAGNMATDGVTVTVLDIDPPVAVAGNDSVAMMGDTVTLDGTASLDNVGITNWTWTFTYRGEERTLEGEVATFTFERVGEFVITLTVADGRGNTAEDTLRLYVKDATPQDVLADGELSTALVAGIVVLVVVAVLVAVVLVMRRRSG